MKKILNQILRLFFLKKRDPNASRTTNVKVMNWMNRIAILTFIVCIIIMLVRFFKH
ncbi:MAG TPA: DUF6728 family protein [Chitinophagaceae bacterium]|nr:DUF6728 family protein [Chitinophagaceae bacterium]